MEQIIRELTSHGNKTLLIITIFVSGIHRSVLSWNIYSGGVPENSSSGTNPAPGKLSSEHVEYYGFCCGGDRVSRQHFFPHATLFIVAD